MLGLLFSCLCRNDSETNDADDGWNPKTWWPYHKIIVDRGYFFRPRGLLRYISGVGGRAHSFGRCQQSVPCHAMAQVFHALAHGLYAEMEEKLGNRQLQTGTLGGEVAKPSCRSTGCHSGVCRSVSCLGRRGPMPGCMGCCCCAVVRQMGWSGEPRIHCAFIGFGFGRYSTLGVYVNSISCSGDGFQRERLQRRSGRSAEGGRSWRFVGAACSASIHERTEVCAWSHQPRMWFGLWSIGTFWHWCSAGSDLHSSVRMLWQQTCSSGSHSLACWK